jgi:hypothetical protein
VLLRGSAAFSHSLRSPDAPALAAALEAALDTSAHRLQAELRALLLK